MTARHSISVKLSALHPRYEFAQRERVVLELAPRLIALTRLAREAGVGLTIDAEEAERLELSLILIDKVLASGELQGYDAFGLAVQAYQKRSRALIEWLIGRCRALGRQVTVRLVKGAYWDSEIKRAQERGLHGYPVFTRKASTDVSYLACARQLSVAGDVIFPQFCDALTRTRSPTSPNCSATARAPSNFSACTAWGGALCAGDRPATRPGLCLPRVCVLVGAHEDLLPHLLRGGCSRTAPTLRS